MAKGEMEQIQGVIQVKKLIISCGGTGGHFMPGLSIARTFQEQGGEVLLLLGGKNAPKQMETARKYNIVSMSFPASYPSGNPVRMTKFLFHLMGGYPKCRKAIKEFQPDALLAMGSFASLAPVLAAHASKVPVFLHDGNTKLGKSNMFLSRYAKAMALSFPTLNAKRAKCPTINTGFPLRPELVSGQLSKAEAIAELNRLYNETLSPEKPTVLVFGGSLGADTINRKLIVEGDPAEMRDVQFLRLTGPGRLDALKEIYAGQNCKVLALESAQEMHLFYSAADLVVSRAGGSTVSELAVYGKYALLLPYPFAAENHQEDNARWLASAGGAEILHDNEASEHDFTVWLQNWLKNQELFRKHGEQSKAIANPDASQQVLDMIKNITSSLK
ncbi:MAG: UDP-N-acetylglucosamine--N-acetylmuramyl-(pentapeptide) pyrophosphoryl-undecaprenol N-acetylglucosamine transferase [Lentisphaerae bacterium]|nr:UDP-N-acetylglucosamine--N-acetylmuramyl-(pentapeptide) pyrophosphoryl-undecaprenol N-acetylglucosamine transferase [Lentisphaerota bacterium]